jgi:hypothetical protein
LVDIGATLSIVPCTSNAGPSGPLLKGADGQPIPSWGFISKTVQFQGKLFTAKFLQAALAGPILGNDFLRKFRIPVAPETSQVLIACMATAPATNKPPLPNISPIVELFVSIPSATLKIPDSVPDDVKRLLQKFPSILRTGDVMPTPPHGVEHHIHTGGSSLKLAFQQAGTQSLVGDVSTEVFCPIVPAQLRNDIFFAFAQPLHPGRLASRCIGSSMFRGAASPTKSPTRKNPACTASGAGSTTTPACCRSPSPSLNGGLLISTLSWGTLYSSVVVSITFSRSLIAYPSGWKQFPFLKIPRQCVNVL